MPSYDAACDEASRLIRARHYADALDLLRPWLMQPRDWSAPYLAGQAYKFLNDIDAAVSHLSVAVAMAPTEAPVLLALGIALQLQRRYVDACATFAKAIAINPDYELAYNSLGMTQKLSGELEKALHNYDAGCKALARRIVKGMKNDRASAIVKTTLTGSELWTDHALHAALYLIAMSDRITGMAMPSGEQAIHEERTEEHGGLFWVDLPDGEAGVTRLFLPNYFNTFREELKRDRTYAIMLGNQVTVLNLLGRHEEAEQHYDAAMEFGHP